MLPLVLLGAALAAEPARPSPAPGLEPQDAPPATRELRVVEESLPASLDPLAFDDLPDRRTHELLYDRLFYRLPVYPEARSHLIDAWKPSPDGRGITLTLAPGWRWHDGQAVQADDVCFTLDAVRDPGTELHPSLLALRHALAGCTVADARTATVTFREPEPRPRDLLQVPVLPSHRSASTALTRATFPNEPVGTGAFRLTERTDSAWKLEAFDQPGRVPGIRRLALHTGSDPFIAVRTLIYGHRTHQLHGIVHVPDSLQPEVAAADGVRLRTHEQRITWGIALNTSHPPLDQPEVRRALDLLLDSGSELRLPWDVPPADPMVGLASGPYPEGSPWLDRGVHTRVLRRRQTEPYPDKVEEAERLLHGAGLRKVEGVWHWKGLPWTPIVAHDPRIGRSGKQPVHHWESLWRARGIRVERMRLPGEARCVGSLPDSVDAAVLPWVAWEGDDARELLHSTGRCSPFELADPTLDALLDTARSAPTDAARRDALHAVQARLLETRSWLWLVRVDTKSAYSDAVDVGSIDPIHYWTRVADWRWADAAP